MHLSILALNIFYFNYISIFLKYNACGWVGDKRFNTGLWKGERERERNVLFNDALNTFYLWLYGVRHIVRKETCCCHIGYSYRLTARVLLYAPSHRQDNTYHGLCYTRRGALAGTRNSSMGPPHEGSIRRPIAP